MLTSHLYRYGHVDGVRLGWLRELILQSHLYVPTTTELNDPLEGVPRFADLTEREAAQFLIKMYHRRTPGASVQDLAINAEVIKRGIERQGLLSVRRDLLRGRRDELRTVRIVSFSHRVDNFSMWAQYANRHQGYCLEFSRIGIFRSARPVVYGDSVPLDLNDDDQDRSIFLFHKKAEWSGEEEQRIVLPRHAHAYLRFDPAALTRIVLGKDMNRRDSDAIRKMARTRVPALSIALAVLNAETHRLEIG